MTFENYFSYGQAEIYTGLSTRTLKRAVANRGLAHIKRGRRTLFRRIDLDRWMEQGLVEAVV